LPCPAEVLQKEQLGLGPGRVNRGNRGGGRMLARDWGSRRGDAGERVLSALAGSKNSAILLRVGTLLVCSSLGRRGRIVRGRMVFDRGAIGRANRFGTQLVLRDRVGGADRG